MDEKWKRMQQIGRSNFLVRYGIVPWSIGLTVLFGLIEVITQGQIIWVWLPIRLLVFAVVGFFIANYKWQSTERKQHMQQINKNK